MASIARCKVCGNMYQKGTSVGWDHPQFCQECFEKGYAEQSSRPGYEQHKQPRNTNTDITTSINRMECTILGGTGYIFSPGDTVRLLIGPDKLVLRSLDGSKAEDIPLLEVVDLSISGPGAVTRAGGFIGGGFGVEGAIEGMAISSILNMLTTRTRIHTFITLVTHLGELHLHYGGMEPKALRIVLSRVFSTLRRLDPIWINSRLEKLKALREQGVIDESEFDHFKQRLLAQIPSPSKF